MGTSYLFVCSKCKYHVEVSGGEDCGFIVKTKTMTCNDCRALVDVSTGHHSHVKDYPFGIDLGVCPKCKGRNVNEWINPGACPKCAGAMIRKDAIVYWD